MSDHINRWWALYDALLDLIEGYQESGDENESELLGKLMADAEYTRGVCESMTEDAQGAESTPEAPAPTADDDVPALRYPAPGQ